MMKAIVYEKYGSPDVLELREVDKPAVTEGAVRVRVHAAGLSIGDWRLLTATPFAVRLYWGLLKPSRTILGHDVSGTVEAGGSKVTQFRVGDEVFGTSTNTGAFAEYMAVAETGLVAKPVDLPHEQAAALPHGGISALQALRDHGHLQPGQHVLINGASGGVGVCAIQIAKALGAQVTAVCSARKRDFVKSLGADQTMDYAVDDFTLNRGHYDVVLDLVGNHSLSACERTLTPNGHYVAVAGSVFRMLRIGIAGGKRMSTAMARPNQADLEYIAQLATARKMSPVIDKRYPLCEVSQAFRYLELGNSLGKIIITP